MSVYGYCRVSRKNQNIERQVRNIVAAYPAAHIVKEAFTSPIAQKFFHTEELIDCLDTHYNGLRDYSRRIWTLFIFIVWYEIYFEDGGHEPGNMPNFSK